MTDHTSFEKELAALGVVIEALLPLDEEARRRVIVYMRDRFWVAAK